MASVAVGGIALAAFALSFFRFPPTTNPDTHTGQPGRVTRPLSPNSDSSARVDATPLSVDTSQASGPVIDFSRAAATALNSPPAQHRAALNAVYFEWGQREPEQATQAALRIAAPDLRKFAVESALSGWSHASPADLADAALAFPAGDEQHAALTKAIRIWLIIDPEKAGDWIRAHPATLEIAEHVIRTENR